MNEKITVGMLVRYAPEWRSPGEEKYLHLVRENRMNPVTGKMTEWLIETLNSGLRAFNPTEQVDECMIEPTGLTLEDLLNERKERNEKR